jgi:transcription elongation factor SPT5
LTYGAEEDDKGAVQDAKRKRGFGASTSLLHRPPPRLFSENEAKKRHARMLQSNRLGGNSFTYKGEDYEEGFLIKSFKLHFLQTDNVHPKLEETQLFAKASQDGAETLDLQTLKRSLHDNAAESFYQVGDEVEVFSGEQRGIIGRVERTAGNIVSVKVSEGDLKDQIVEVPVKSLRKRFREGDNVIVIGASKYRDQVGTVLKIQNDKVTILSQDSQAEITVFSRDLREASGVAASSERSQFDVRDLVQLTATTFGCVVAASPQNVMVMETTGEVVPRAPSSISVITFQRKQVSVDRNGQEIKVGDSVKEIAGDGHSGNIIHVYRNFCFAVDTARMVEHAGIWVSRCNAVVSRGGKVGAGGGMNMSAINPALKAGTMNGAMLPPQRPGPDRLLRQRVKIRQGMYKGHRGIVKDTTAGEARVELESKNKVVNISKDHLGVIEYVMSIILTEEANSIAVHETLTEPPRRMLIGLASEAFRAEWQLDHGSQKVFLASRMEAGLLVGAQVLEHQLGEAVLEQVPVLMVVRLLDGRGHLDLPHRMVQQVV